MGTPEHSHPHGHGPDRFSDEASGWDDKPGHAERAEAVAALLRQALPLRADLTVLEIGGGTGLLSRALAGDIGTATVTDVAPGMVEVAAAKLDDPRFEGWSARRYDIEHDPLPDERYDLVVALLALHHMGDIAAVVQRCVDLLAEGGHVAIIDLDHDADGAFHQHVVDFDGHHGFTRDDLRGWFEAAGARDVRVTDGGTVTKETEDGERDFPMFLAVARQS